VRGTGEDATLNLERRPNSDRPNDHPTIEKETRMSLVKRARKTAADSGESTASTASDAASTVAEAASDAASAVKDAATSAWDKVVPAAGTAWEKAAPATQDAYAKVSDAVAPAVGVAVEKGRRHGRRAAMKLSLVEEPKKKHRLRKLLTVLGIAAAAAFVYKKLSAGSNSMTGAHTDNGGPSGFTTATGGSSSVTSTGNETAPTAPLPAKESKTSPVPTDPDNPTQKTKIS
jgi:hypothetical protein